jgi:hypothetical protein
MSTEITQEELDGLRALCEAIPAIYTCTEGFNCKWQGFGMLRGVGAGLIANTTPEWRERHEQQCPGQLIQVTPNDAMPRLLDALAAAQKENERLREGLGVLADVSVFLADLSAELQASDHLSDKFKQTSVLALLLAVDKARARFGREPKVLKITDPPKPWSPCKPGPDGKCVECGRPVSDAARALLGEEARDE